MLSLAAERGCRWPCAPAPVRPVRVPNPASVAATWTDSHSTSEQSTATAQVRDLNTSGRKACSSAPPTRRVRPDRTRGKLGALESSWEEKAELALSKGREDLAKAALVERQKATDMAERLDAEIAVLDDALKASEADIAKLQSKLRDARARQSAIATRMETAHNRIRVREAYSGDRVQDAFSRFDVLEKRADLAEGRADALAMGAPKTLEEEIAELQSSEKVDAALEALKAKAAGRAN